MPDKFGNLSVSEMGDVARRFEKLEKERGRDLECEVCGNIVWEVPGSLSALVGDAVDGPAHARFRLPVLVFVCNKCGNAKSFASHYMNISPFKEEVAENTGESPEQSGGDQDGR